MQKVLIVFTFIGLVIAALLLRMSPLGHAFAAHANAHKRCASVSKVHGGRITRVKVCRSTLVVDARSDIYGAGHAQLPPARGGPGLFPAELKFKAGRGKFLTFPSVTGSVSGAPTLPAVGPEGARGFNTAILGGEGLSGITDHSHAMFLVGVFLTDKEPTDPAPPTLDFTDAEGFTPLAPKLRQVFYIGDGAYLQVNVPRRATRLYLGFADGPNFQGAPGFYDDNTGSLTVKMVLTG